jgi:hypothetical protein
MSGDQVADQVTAYGEQVIDLLADGFEKFRVKDRANGDYSDEGALGGIGMLVDEAAKHGPTNSTILLALAVRRLADLRAAPDASS